MAVIAATSNSARAAVYLDVVISEIMYHAPGDDSQGEFVEITNRGSQNADLTGWKLGDGIQYAFPAGTILAPGARRVIAKDPTAAATLYGISGILGPFSGRLDNDGERIELRDASDGLVCEVEYDDQNAWPSGGDGDGRSIELTDLTRNGNVGRFWKPSQYVLGTPGAANVPGGTPPVTVVINEFLANSSTLDRIELYNYGDSPVDLNNYYLTDNPRLPTKAKISASWSAGTTIIPAKGFWVSTQNDWATFALSSSGEQIYLIGPDGRTWVDGVDFSDQPVTDASEGRYPDGNRIWMKMLTTSFGAPNIAPPPKGVIINEIMYHPLGDSEVNPGKEYLELRNLNAVPVSLAGWRLSGGIDYQFPAGTTIAAAGYLVVAKNPALVQSSYGITGVLGPYSGVLSNFSDELRLEDALGNRVDVTEYRQEGLWPTSPDGTGPSLELVTLAVDKRLPGAWRPSSGQGTPGSANSQSVANPAASFDRVRHAPLVPTASQTVTVSARVGAGNLTSVTLYYKRDQDTSFANTPMYDDGAHGDEYAGDGIYGGTLPVQANGTIVEFYIQANATGGNARFPSSTSQTCLYIVQNTPEPTSNLTYYRLILTDENHNWMVNSPNDESLRDCTFIFGDRVYYNCGIRLRGGARGGPKYSFKIFITPGYHFRGADRFNLNYEKNDETLLTNKIVYHALDYIGLPSARVEFTHTRYRNTYGGVHYYLESHCSDYLDNHFPNDAEGNMYKGISPWTTATAWREDHSRYEKETNEELNDWSDLDQLGNVTSNAPNSTYEAQVRSIVDVVNWGRSFAVLGTFTLIDTPWHFHNQNYRLYRRLSDNRFIHLLYDFDDSYWDTMYNNAGWNASVFPDTNRFLEWPAFKRELLHGGWRMVNSTDGVVREARMESEFDYYYGLIYNDVQLDPFSGTGTRWTLFQSGKTWWKSRLATRNTLLRGQLPSAVLAITTNGGQPITTASASLTLAGTAPISAPRLEVFGSESIVKWTSTTAWQVQLTLTLINNTVVVRTLTDDGTEIQRTTIQVTYTNGVPGGPEFTADTTSGPAPLTVRFTDQSTVPGVSAWLWEFGDGTTSNLQNPTHQFAAEGSYTVRLTVTAPGGAQFMEKPNYIKAVQLPRIAFIAGQKPLTIDDAAVVTYLEGMGTKVNTYDDEPANRPNAVQITAAHELVIASSTTVSANVAGEFRNQAIPYIYWESALSLIDRESLANGSNFASNQTQLNIVNNTHPITAGLPLGLLTVAVSGADFSYSSGPIASGVQVLATQAGNTERRMILVAEPGATLLDGGTAAHKRIFLYLYDTTWSSLNNTGKTIFRNAVVYALGAPTVGFSASVTRGNAPLNVQFTDTSSGPVSQWSWDFGDGTSSTLRHPAHSYAAVGTYTVSLTVSGLGQTDTVTRTDYIQVIPPVTPDLDGDNDVDDTDVYIFATCITGSAAGPPTPACLIADLDLDNDVDLSDFGILQRCLSGPGVPLNSSCMQP